MIFLSTRGKDKASNASEAILKGLAGDGGLFVPQTFPDFSLKINELLGMDYAEMACTVIGSYLDEYDKEELLSACRSAYAKFDDNDAAPVVKIDDNLFILELFHGPTLAFKDIALTLLPHLLRKGADNCGVKDEILILVATSGDTGKAALEGFRDAKGIKINVFYPSEGVSDMQKLQMRTQEGENVNVVAVKGNFDDCQTAVKKIFSDKQINSELKEKGVILSSANSINFGRLVPQITYYFSAYCDLVNAGEIKLGDKIDFCVPTGNFGNILAGYYAKRMGLPINKLICASNENNVLTEFFASGNYDKNREFFKTMSPSMDILVSSNLERLIFELSERDGKITEERMKELSEKGTYSVTDNERKAVAVDFFAGYADENECKEEINDFFEEYGYVPDPHTSVALYVAQTFGFKIPTVVLSTASPYKFPQSVLSALSGKTVKDAFLAKDKLFEYTAYPVPIQISALREKEVRFFETVERDDVYGAVKRFLKIQD